ncbi:GreA/GreB family elongation factor [Pseudonocardia lacus]|uniref:GreA/GreB family elongation factor n=1 Tax=Pseudonocardia lacus TaxID=2835865 RepID=UPI001BDC022B|nr:GreA/GreB family elongation factor [Pseudonocardia lacus]
MSRAQVWLTRDAHERLQAELTELVRRHTQAPPARADVRDTGDPLSEQKSLDDRREQRARIRRLQEILRDAQVSTPPDDGVAEPGMVLTVRFDDDPDPETFLLAHRDDSANPGVETCSPDSPLGRALVGAREGERRRYALPDGRDMRVTLLRAVPYGAHHP